MKEKKKDNEGRNEEHRKVERHNGREARHKSPVYKDVTVQNIQSVGILQ
jgi:hypothetical protein